MLDSPDDPTLRAIGFLYIVCTHATDTDLTETERDLVVAKIEGRIVAASQPRVAAAVRGALQLYRAQTTPEAIWEEIDRTAATLPALMDPASLGQIIADLVEMAHADGSVSDPESQFIARVATAWGVNVQWYPAG